MSKKRLNKDMLQLIKHVGEDDTGITLDHCFMREKKKKLLIIAAANNFHFIKDIAEAMRDKFEIDYFNPDSPCPCMLDLYDAIWFEWFDGFTPQILELPKLTKTKYIVRLHRYELFTPRTLAAIQSVTDSGDYKKIDKLIFVSEFVRQIGISKFPWMGNSVVIPNLFDHTKFPLQSKCKSDSYYNLLFLGRISYVKNLPLCLTMFHELLKLDSNYKLHIVGDISDPELKYYLWNFVGKNKILENVKYYSRIDHEKLPAFMADMGYVICSSIFESTGIGIIESMSAGLKPVVFNFPGAEQLYPEKWLWTDRTGFVNSILGDDYNSQRCHDYAVDNYSVQKNVGLYKKLIEEI